AAERRDGVAAAGLPAQRLPPRLERAREIGVTASAHLNEQRVETAATCRLHDGADRSGSRQARAGDPECPHLVPPCPGVRRWGEEDYSDDDEGGERRGQRRARHLQRTGKRKHRISHCNCRVAGCQRRLTASSSLSMLPCPSKVP